MTYGEAPGLPLKLEEIKGFTASAFVRLPVIPLSNVVTSTPPRVVAKRRKRSVGVQVAYWTNSSLGGM